MRPRYPGLKLTPDIIASGSSLMNEAINDTTTMRRLGAVILTLCGITVGLLVIVSVVSHAV